MCGCVRAELGKSQRLSARHGWGATGGSALIGRGGPYNWACCIRETRLLHALGRRFITSWCTYARKLLRVHPKAEAQRKNTLLEHSSVPSNGAGWGGRHLKPATVAEQHSSKLPLRAAPRGVRAGRTANHNTNNAPSAFRPRVCLSCAGALGRRAPRGVRKGGELLRATPPGRS